MKITSSSKAYITNWNYDVLFSDVTPLDSSHGLIDNSPYINGIVKIALSALNYIYGMENKTTAGFHHFADGIEIAVENGIHPAYDGYKQGWETELFDLYIYI